MRRMNLRKGLLTAALAMLTMGCGLSALAQQTPPPTTPPADQNPTAGGPATDNSDIVITKKKEQPDAPPPAAPAEPVVKNPANLQNFSLHVDVPLVTVDVSVQLDKTRQFVPGLKPENFRVYEDGVEQRVKDVRITQTPITAVMLLEFASTNYNFIYDMRNAAYTFFSQLRPDDYIAVVTYDMRTQILTDFTHDKQVVAEALNSLTIPGFRETNMFDALYETLDRLTRIDGRKDVILISSGIDTFSKINLDKILAKIKATPNVTIFCVGTGGMMREMSTGGGGGMGSAMRNMDYLQADNQLNTFAKMTGGLTFHPVFVGAMPDIFREINASIRNQYLVTYTPSNMKLDGTYRKIHVELVDNEGKPLRMADEKGKAVKYDVIARDGYKAKQQVE